jgi:hypothetical protein
MEQFFTVSHADKPIQITIQVKGTLKDRTVKNGKKAVRALEVIIYQCFS